MKRKFNGRYDLTNGGYILVQWYAALDAYYVYTLNEHNIARQYIASEQQLRKLLKEQGV